MIPAQLARTFPGGQHIDRFHSEGEGDRKVGGPAQTEGRRSLTGREVDGMGNPSDACEVS